MKAARRAELRRVMRKMDYHPTLQTQYALLDALDAAEDRALQAEAKLREIPSLLSIRERDAAEAHMPAPDLSQLAAWEGYLNAMGDQNAIQLLARDSGVHLPTDQRLAGAGQHPV